MSSTNKQAARHRSGLASFRAYASPIAGATLFFFAESALAPAVAWAQSSGGGTSAPGSNSPAESEARDERVTPKERAQSDARPDAVLPAEKDATAPADRDALAGRDTKSAVAPTRAAPDTPVLDQADSAPVGGDKTGITSKAISLPQGSGKIQGMGESFSAQLSTGIATFSVPFALPHARGGAQPSLGLSYSSSGGFGLAGVGWDVGVPFIARQTDRGLPNYADATGFDPNQDRFVFNGGQELVPICVVSGSSCLPSQGGSGALPGEVMPAWASGAQYFRPRVEGSYLRFFWSIDHRTWRVQDKSGVTMEIGVPLDGSNDTSALDVNPDHPEQIYRWHLVRQYDAQGAANPTTAAASPTPNNVLVYRYFQSGNQAYLSDIFDTTPATNPSSLDTSQYAHHTRLTYEQRTDPTFSFRSGWRMDQAKRLARVDVTSKTYNDAVTSPRHQLRRYRLSYDPSYHASLLASVQVEGRCAGAEANAPIEQSGSADPGAPPGRLPQVLPDTTGCETLPAMTFGYSHVPGSPALPGYEPFNETIHSISSSPNYSVDPDTTELIDINGDGLPDVLDTRAGHQLFLNSSGGTSDSFGPSVAMGTSPGGTFGSSLKFSSPNLAALDLDGDGTANLVLAPPQNNTYYTYTPTLRSGSWLWSEQQVTPVPGASSKVYFGQDRSASKYTRVMDVNGDGLVDVVVSTGLQYQTFFALGRLPQGSSQFGNGALTGPRSSQLSGDPVATCVPTSGGAVQLADSEIRVADMNGDGLPDLVRVRTNGIQYWPGRGDGVWGVGARETCQPDTFSDKRAILMSNNPHFTDVNQTTLRLEDVNGDGLEDLVQLNSNAVEVWLNVDGIGWTAQRLLANVPQSSPLNINRERLVDINGSGTPDVLWANAKSYQYIDLQDGIKPWLLTHVENGLGKSTDIDYSTSTAEMLAAEKLPACDTNTLATSPWGCRWQSKMPMVAHVVKRVTESDNLPAAGQTAGKYVTEYQYRDPLFEGRQREFRGFQRARSKRLGDANSPSDYTESAFLLGECEDETPSDGVDQCGDRSTDNPREALKGLPIFTEKYDENGAFLSTDSSVYRLRQLYTGLDGRVVRQAFESSKQTVKYDTAASFGGATVTNPNVVELELKPPATTWDPVANQLASPGTPAVGETYTNNRSAAIPVRAVAGTATLTSKSEVDFFGNKLVAFDYGCDTRGGSSCPPVPAGMNPDERLVHVTKAAPVTGENSHWLWRTTESWAAGSVHKDQRSHLTMTYDSAGNPLTTYAELKGVVALDRFTLVPANGIAPLPATRSTEASNVLVSSNTYNHLGLLTQEQAALARCRDVAYDAQYSEFASSETIHTSGGCASTGIAALVTGATYDRGLGAPVNVTDMQGQISFVQYDAFGRMTSLFRPSPTQQGGQTAHASVLISYALPSATNPVRYSVVHSRTQDGKDESTDSYLESFAYVDGLGRTVATLSEADPSANDVGKYIVGAREIYDAKGAVSRKYLPYFTDSDPMSSPGAFSLGSAPTSAYGRQRYDAFGRQVQTFDLDGTVTLQSVYHALSTDLYDAADLENGPHQGTYASMQMDGHGRTIVTTERSHVNGTIEAHDVRTQYLSTGEPEVITRVRVGKSDAPVVRWMRYDTLGHLVLNVDPHTTKNYSSVPSTDPTPSSLGLKAWRYAYDDAGDLVGTSDARGCGENFEYDGAGRILTEDYSPCGTGGQGPYTAPSWTSGFGPTGYEVVYWYDSAPLNPFIETFRIVRPANYATAVSSDKTGASPFLQGRLVTVWSRGKAQWNSYDGRGRLIQTAVLPALPLSAVGRVSSPYIYARFGRRFYYRDFVFDGADREVSATTGSSVTQLQGVANTSLPSGQAKSAVTTEYSARGTVRKVHSTYGDLVTDVTRTADGLVQSITYGDLAKTRTDTDYDARRRLRNVQTYRGPPDIWNSAPATYTPAPAFNATPSSFQLILQDQELTYDVVGNPTEIRDYRTPSEWPAGAKPVTQKAQYDDLYRATRIDYQTPGGTDAWTSPFSPELAGVPALADPRRAVPAPHVKFDTRPLFQTFNYDWLGNTVATDDDTHGFYDRSLGTVTNDTAHGRPYQLVGASNKSGPATTRSGSVAAVYDEMGNVLRVNIERNGTCLPASSPCSTRLDLNYDEVGRLARIFRRDMPASSLPPITSNSSAAWTRDLQFLYDENDERIVKTSTVGATNTEISTLYPFETLEVRGTVIDPAITSYSETTLTADNEVPYLVAHGVRLARVHYEEAPRGEPRLSTATNPSLHVFFELGDHLGSTDIVIDKATSELVEASTYQGYGAKESDYRADRWKGYRDDYGFTGKEDDVEFGVVYFGKRFYSPLLGRWITADPLAVHSPGSADLNLYAYVKGQILKSVDPIGLELRPGETRDADGNIHGGTIQVTIEPIEDESSTDKQIREFVGGIAQKFNGEADGVVAAYRGTAHGVASAVLTSAAAGPFAPIVAFYSFLAWVGLGGPKQLSSDLAAPPNAESGERVGETVGAPLFMGASMPELAPESAAPEAGGPRLFVNKFPEHQVNPPCQTYEPGQLATKTGKINYVVLEDMTLRLGRIRSDADGGGGHIDLAGGRPVRAAGVVFVLRGVIRYVDNSSGHYEPSGPEAQSAAESAFGKAGIDITGKYVEKVWNGKSWVPR